MSQFNTDFPEIPNRQPPMYPLPTETQRTSALAILSLVFGLLFCIPFAAPALGVLFGIIALVLIARSNGTLRGQGLAIAGLIVSGVVLCAHVAITVIIVAQFLDTALTDPAVQETSVGSREPFLEMFQAWFMATFKLSIKIFFIIMFVLILLEIFRVLNWINPVVRISNPFLKILGLDEKVGTLWIIAAIFGLGLGAAAIVEEAKEGNLSKEDLEGLHLSIGINHSLIEDPALFLPLGLSPFWLWVPRLIMAMVAVRLLTLWRSIAVKHSKKRLIDSP